MERAFGIFDLCMAVESAGYAFKCAGELPLEPDEMFPDNDCVVVNGPAAQVAELCGKRRWIPGAWCDPQAFACQTYYGHWPALIVQKQFVFLPFGALMAQKAALFESLGENGRLFIRPDSFDKSFDGSVIEHSDFDTWIRGNQNARIPASSLCVVSRPVTIENEWRLIIRDKRVIAGSSYRIGKQINKTQTPPPDAVQFAETVAAAPYPGLPNLFVLDVGTVSDRLAVVEVGSVNACGYYGSDLSLVIKAISDEAEMDWERSRKHI